MTLIVLTALFGLWGIALGSALFIVILAFTKTVDGKRYTYPIIPFDRKAAKKILFRATSGREEE